MKKVLMAIYNSWRYASAMCIYDLRCAITGFANLIITSNGNYVVA
jgi:hypothetical protein